MKMSNKFTEILEKYFKKINGNIYKKIKVDNKNFYYIYEMEIIIINENISSFKANPLGLIVEDNKKFHLYYLDENKDFKKNQNEVIKDFVNSTYLGNGTFSDSNIISIK